METKHDILMNNKRGIQFKFTIYRKFTIIRGTAPARIRMQRAKNEI